ncbi:hypothetical protein IE53DRAFT_410982 [Violaceomyces palustris]|uniref:Uncharacterized protein n=1 Tax=Violaceomyces palustris TaxID=1673888 RepID=A0ACD0NX41_9BASI|nr:hypothetical protein IE53DRAFT_410982 [Violaceomyces palustris]
MVATIDKTSFGLSQSSSGDDKKNSKISMISTPLAISSLSSPSDNLYSTSNGNSPRGSGLIRKASSSGKGKERAFDREQHGDGEQSRLEKSKTEAQDEDSDADSVERSLSSPPYNQASELPSGRDPPQPSQNSTNRDGPGAIPSSSTTESEAAIRGARELILEALRRNSGSAAASSDSGHTPARPIRPLPRQGSTGPETASQLASAVSPIVERDPLAAERARAREQIRSVLGQAPPGTAPSHGGVLGSDQTAAPSSTLAALLGDVFGFRRPQGASDSPATGPGAVGSNASAVGSATNEGQGLGMGNAAQRQPFNPAAHGGTSVIVQGALIARTVPSRPQSSQGSPSPAENPSSSPGHPLSTTRHTYGSSASGLRSRAEANSNLAANDPLARTASSPDIRAPHSSAIAGNNESPGQRTTSPQTAAGRLSQGTGGLRMGEEQEPQAATLEEQAAMLSRILGIATAATAASLVSPTTAQGGFDRSALQDSLQSMQTPPPTGAGASLPSPDSAASVNSSRLSSERLAASVPSQQPAPPSSHPASGASATSSSITSSLGLGQGLRGRLAALSNRVRSVSTGDRFNRDRDASSTPVRPPQSESQLAASLLQARRRSSASLRGSAGQNGRPREEAFTAQMLSQMMRDSINQMEDERRRAAGTDVLVDQASTGNNSEASVTNANEATAPASAGRSSGPNDVAGPLHRVREGLPLPEGEPGSFGYFLHHLLRDLHVAVQGIRPDGGGRLNVANVGTGAYGQTGTEVTNGAEVLDADGDEHMADAVSPAREGLRDLSGTTDSSASSSEVTEVDNETRRRRERDLEGGQLSFFRLFRFEPVAPSTLIPCVVVGVRSLGYREGAGATTAEGPGSHSTALHSQAGVIPPGATLQEQRDVLAAQNGSPPSADSGNPIASVGSADDRTNQQGPGASATTTTTEETLPASRFLLFVSGGRYPENHPLLTANPSAAGRDLMILMELLGTMASMGPAKPSTVTAEEIEKSGLRKVKGGSIRDLCDRGEVKENTVERCTVCLEDWTEDDDCRLLACQHVFHASCVDRWLTSSSNTCPMCRRQGVTKDGTSAGEMPPDSQNPSTAAAAAAEAARLAGM